MDRLPRYRTGDRDLDRAVAELVDHAAPQADADLVFELVTSALRLARDEANRGDLKIANAALKEMRYAFHVFSPYRDTRKAAMFGSARTAEADPLYAQARDFASRLVAHDWMLITGAGPGIMTAGLEGAGVDNAFGVNIRLPFEAVASALLADDPKLVHFRYFFTRKLTFVKESDAFALLPGGFGTLDETFEVLTLVQTGKGQPAPIVLLDAPGGTYWAAWRQFVEEQAGSRRYVSPGDLGLVFTTDDVEAAVDECVGFYANYQSLRFVEGTLVLRMRHAPRGLPLEELTRRFSDILVRGGIERIDATPAEVADDDDVGLERLALRFDRRNWARLRVLIDVLNGRA